MLMICNNCGTKNNDKAIKCKKCGNVLIGEKLSGKSLPADLPVTERRVIPQTMVFSEPTPPRNIPSTQVGKSETKTGKDDKRHIPSTVVQQGGPPRAIPSTVVQSVKSSSSPTRNKNIPETVVSNKTDNNNIQKEPNQLNITDAQKPELDLDSLIFDALEATPVAESEQNDIFSKYDNIISPIFTNPQGFEMQLDIDKNIPPLPEIRICPSCQAENLDDSDSCQTCGYLFSKSEDTTSTIPTGTNYPQLKLINEGKEETFYLADPEAIIGRSKGTLLFSDAKHLSATHAKIYHYERQLAMMDLGSLNGSYIRLKKPYLLNHGDIFSIGQQIFQFRRMVLQNVSVVPKRTTMAFVSTGSAPEAKLVYYLENGGYDLLLLQPKTVMGRQQGNFVFPDDEAVGNPHVSIVRTPRGYILQDLDSKSGTWLRINKPCILRDGDMIRLGEYIFTLHLPDRDY